MVHKKGFTLIELIIVIALIALLATTVILVINPVKIFQEARDSQRIADLGQMNSAMSLMLATSSAQPVLGPVAANCHQYAVAQDCKPRYTPASTAATAVQSQLVNGTGWVPVDLGATPAISAWPIDPKNDVTNFYSYAFDAGNTWEFTAKMESTRYKQGGSDDVESTDGGNKAALFEVGTNVNL
jgi:prepilin-type N-terminal cleavage/methylation domain-containing protein